MKNFLKRISVTNVLLLILLIVSILNSEESITNAGNFELEDQAATISAIKENEDAVVNIVVHKDVIVDVDGVNAVVTDEVGAGTGFLISSDGFIITNKHVVNAGQEKSVQYRIVLNSGKKYYAQLIAVDVLYDIAVLKIYDKNLPYVEFGDSDKMEVGATVIAIGNVLGRYQNSATKGIISGLGRDFLATDKNGGSEFLTNTIQTDAEINFGNSGGPLINLDGKVIGVNVAVDQSGSSIGFAIPINDIISIVNDVVDNGIIMRPKLGIYYIMVTPELVEEKSLLRDSGALVFSDKEDSVLDGSAADIAEILEGDIIFEINAIKINEENNLRSIIQMYKPGDRIGMKIQRGSKVIIREVTLGKF